MSQSNRIAELIEHYLQGKCTREEFRETIELLKEAGHHLGVYSALSGKWKDYEPGDSAISEEEKNELRKTLSVIHHKSNLSEGQWTRRSSATKAGTLLVKMAAALLLPVLAFGLWYFISSQEPYSASGDYITINTPEGSKIRTELPDGTVVWQNSGSTLKYPRKFTPRNREVILTGEAFFDVTSDKMHPFFVATGELRIRVTGTRLNVTGYPGEGTSVVLQSGKITVQSLEQENAPELELKPGDRLVSLPGERKKIIHGVDVEKHVSWIHGKLIFRDDPLKDILIRLSRWYNVDIVVNDPQGKIRDLPFTMTIERESFSQILEYLQHAAPISIKEEKLVRRDDGTFRKPRFTIEYRN